MSFSSLPSLVFTTIEIDTTSPLLDLLPESADAANIMTFVRADEGLVGWGRALTFNTNDSQRFTAVSAWWESLLAHAVIKNPLTLPGTGPVVFTSFSFDSASGTPSTAIIPKNIVGRHAGRSWFTTVRHDGEAVSAPENPCLFPQPPQSGLRRPPTPPQNQLSCPSWAPASLSEGILSPQKFMDAVDVINRQIQEGEISKAVIARDLKVTTGTPLNIVELLTRLERQEDAWTICAGGLVGASPEMLLHQRGLKAWSRVLAGSRPASDTTTKVESLLANDSLRTEHEFSVLSVEEAFGSLDAATTRSIPFLLPLKTIRHIATDIEATLKPCDTPFQTLEALHPSAAICGTPRRKAQQLIRRLETGSGMDRGRFSGPFGWTDSGSNADWCIALRCGMLSPDQKAMRLYAGCGIVAGADPEAELQESTDKFNSMLMALGAMNNEIEQVFHRHIATT